MGRELKRVPLDFKWHRKQIWKGYINPFHSQKCKACDGEGLNEATKKISDDWYSFDKAQWVYPNGPNEKRYNNLAWEYHLTDLEVDALMKKGRLRDFTNGDYVYYEEKKKTWVKWVGEGKERKKVKCEKPKYPTAEEVNEWAKNSPFGHDSSNKWTCVKARAEHLGVYGKCPYCKGEGEIWQSPRIKKMANDWKSFGPPKGKGYQLWETTSEGSPASPVFKTLEELCEWCETNATVFADNKVSKEKWMKMLSNDNVYHQEGNAIFI